MQSKKTFLGWWLARNAILATNCAHNHASGHEKPTVYGNYGFHNCANEMLFPCLVSAPCVNTESATNYRTRTVMNCQPHL